MHPVVAHPTPLRYSYEGEVAQPRFWEVSGLSTLFEMITSQYVFPENLAVLTNLNRPLADAGSEPVAAGADMAGAKTNGLIRNPNVL